MLICNVCVDTLMFRCSTPCLYLLRFVGAPGSSSAKPLSVNELRRAIIGALTSLAAAKGQHTDFDDLTLTTQNVALSPQGPTIAAYFGFECLRTSPEGLDGLYW